MARSVLLLCLATLACTGGDAAIGPVVPGGSTGGDSGGESGGESGEESGGDSSGDSGGDDTGEAPVDADGDGFPAEEDCDDADPLVFPGAEERCDGVDTDCDGAIAETRVPEDFALLQEAIDAAPDGGWICLDEGRHPGLVEVVGKSLRIEGRGSGLTTLLGGEDAAGTVLRAEEAGLELVGLTVAEAAGERAVGIELVETNAFLVDVVLEQLECEASRCEGVGLHVTGGLLSLTEVVLRDIWAVAVEDATGVGLYARDVFVGAEDLVIDGLSAEATGEGAYVLGVAMALEEDSVLEASDLWLTGGVAEADSVYGVGLYEAPGARAELTRAVIAGNAGTASTYVDGVGLDLFGETVLDAVLILDNHGYAAADGEPYVCGIGIISHGTHMRAANVTVHGNSGEGTVIRGPGWYNRATDGELVNVVLSGNVVHASVENRGAQLSVSGSEDPIIRYTAIEPGDDDVYGMEDWLSGEGNLSVAPDYTDVSGPDWTTWDLRPAEGSPLVDAGDPAILDGDGSRSDIGAHGGASAGE